MSPSTMEEKRLAALAASQLLDPAPEEPLDRLTRFAAKILQVPVVFISLIERDHQFFKSQCGLPPAVAETRRIPLSYSICKHVVETGEPLIIADARIHPLVKTNLAVRDLGVVAYAGVPLIDGAGYRLGSFCAIDTKPRDWTPDEIELLTGLAAQAMTEIELRNKTRELGHDLTSARQLQRDRDSFTQLTVHDLRFPLGSMLLCLEMLPLLGPFTADQKESMSLCLRSGQMLRSILDDLFDVAAIEQSGQNALCYDLLDPGALGDLAISQITTVAKEKTIAIERAIPSGLPKVRADEHKIVRLLANALDLAIKSTRCGGRVRFSAQLIERPVALIVFSIVDEEASIHRGPTANNSNGDQPAAEVIKAREGSELALAYCRKVAEAHGGSISVEIATDQRRTIKVSLPVTVTLHQPK